MRAGAEATAVVEDQAPQQQQQQGAGMPNLFDDLPARPAPTERLDTLLSAPGVRLERIVSTGHLTPPGEWYDQATDEWVLVLRGRARLRFDDRPESVALEAGDHILIRAHHRHRVEWTDPEAPTVWLALHYGGVPRP